MGFRLGRRWLKSHRQPLPRQPPATTAPAATATKAGLCLQFIRRRAADQRSFGPGRSYDAVGMLGVGQWVPAWDAHLAETDQIAYPGAAWRGGVGICLSTDVTGDLPIIITADRAYSPDASATIDSYAGLRNFLWLSCSPNSVCLNLLPGTR